MTKIIDEKDIKNEGTKGNPHCTAEQKTFERENWRTFKPVIDKKKCIQCYNCWLHCPDASYTIDKDGFPKCDSKTCKGCGICASVCPVKCIKMVREKK